MNGENHKLMSF